jgi:hypothetical protein
VFKTNKEIVQQTGNKERISQKVYNFLKTGCFTPGSVIIFNERIELNPLFRDEMRNGNRKSAEKFHQKERRWV